MNKTIKTTAGFTAAAILACQSFIFANPKSNEQPTNAGAPSHDIAGIGGTPMPAGSLNNRGDMSEKDFDQHFAKDAAEDNMTEIAVAKVVEGKTQDPQVKQFAQTLIRDHEQAGQKLQAIAQQKGMTLPTQLGELGNAKVAKAEKLSGPALDRHFVFGMVGDHAKDVLCYRSASQMLSDPQLKEFAEQTLPTLQEHLHMARQLANDNEAMTAGAHMQGSNSNNSANNTTNGGSNK